MVEFMSFPKIFGMLNSPNFLFLIKIQNLLNSTYTEIFQLIQYWALENK